MMGRWWRIYERRLGVLEYQGLRWAQTGEGAILGYRAGHPRKDGARPVVAIPEDQIVAEKA